MLDLNINDLRKQALIRFSKKPDGHVFTVHRLGAGSELELSRLSREANKLILKLEQKPSDKELAEIFNKISVLDEERLKVKASVLEDGGDGSLSLALAKELSDDELTRIVQSVESGISITESNAIDESKAESEQA